MKRLNLTLVAFLSLTSSGWSGLVISFDPADLSVISTGADQTVDVGILIQHDGVGDNTLSGFTLGYSSGDPALVPIADSTFASDFEWSLLQARSDTSITGANDTDHTIDTTGTQLLGTLQFTLDGSFTEGTIPIGLTFTDAQRGGFPGGEEIDASEFTITGGDLIVAAAAVPEPGSLAMMGLAACGALGLRRRKRAIYNPAACSQVPSI